ncbi:MAG: PHP domain-containing protein [Anaerolineae bacterium]
MRVDLHCHSRWSPDSGTTLEAIIKAVAARGLDALALTDHNAIDGALALADCAPFTVIVGEEVKTAEGEIIGLYLSEWIPGGLSPEATIDAIHAQGGVAYVPHPFDRIRGSTLTRGALARVAHRLDAIEAYNSRCLFPHFNLRAAAFARRMDLPAGAGSDAHAPDEIGAAWVEVADCDLSKPEDLLRCLSAGRIHGRATGPLGRLAPAAVRARRRIAAWRRRTGSTRREATAATEAEDSP